jgi:hypothetical protein
MSLEGLVTSAPHSDAMSTVSSSMRHGAKAEHDAAGGAITASDVIIATGQELTPAMLADRERLMHERRLMAYHNTRLVLALQALGATGEAALEALQRRTLGDDDEDETQGCRECRAAAIQMRAMDRTVARASLFIESAREQLKAVKSQRAAMTDEVSQLRANLLRCEELLRAKDAEIARLRSEVYHNQPAIEELLALRRTQGDLMQRIRLLQTADPTVRIVQGSSRAAIEAPKAEAETQTAPTVSATASSTASALHRAVYRLEEDEERSRVDLLSRFFAFHNLSSILCRTEGTVAEMRRHLHDADEARHTAESLCGEARLRSRDLEIELRSMRTRFEMMDAARQAAVPGRSPHALQQSQLQLPSSTKPQIPLSPSATGRPQAAPAAGVDEEQLRREVWTWALHRVQTTLDDAMVQIQEQVDEAYALGVRHGHEKERLTPTRTTSHNTSGAAQQITPRRSHDTSARSQRSHRHSRGPPPGSIDSVTSIEDN